MGGRRANSRRKYECTICKTVTPSLFFSRSSEVTFPTEHHVLSSPASRIAAAQAGADKIEKGKHWYDGLVLPGTLDLDGFLFTDKKLSVVFDDEELVSNFRNKHAWLLMLDGTNPLASAIQLPIAGLRPHGDRLESAGKTYAVSARESHLPSLPISTVAVRTRTDFVSATFATVTRPKQIETWSSTAKT